MRNHAKKSRSIRLFLRFRIAGCSIIFCFVCLMAAFYCRRRRSIQATNSTPRHVTCITVYFVISVSHVRQRGYKFIHKMALLSDLVQTVMLVWKKYTQFNACKCLGYIFVSSAVNTSVNSNTYSYKKIKRRDNIFILKIIICSASKM